MEPSGCPSMRGAIRLHEEPSGCPLLHLEEQMHSTAATRGASAVAEHGGAPVRLHRPRRFLLRRLTWKSTRHQSFVGRQSSPPSRYRSFFSICLLLLCLCILLL
uniref:Uncharacterized protein n=1 Tax=Triticum urartu TaxID=4572 RepID=A0A8R7UP53_TRIUA